jgi:hypothetical protein
VCVRLQQDFRMMVRAIQAPMSEPVAAADGVVPIVARAGAGAVTRGVATETNGSVATETNAADGVVDLCSDSSGDDHDSDTPAKRPRLQRQGGDDPSTTGARPFHVGNVTSPSLAAAATGRDSADQHSQYSNESWLADGVSM